MFQVLIQLLTAWNLQSFLDCVSPFLSHAKDKGILVVCQYLNITMMGQENLAQQGKNQEDNLQGDGEAHTGPHSPCGPGFCHSNFQMMIPVCSSVTRPPPPWLSLSKSWPSLGTGSVLPPPRRPLRQLWAWKGLKNTGFVLS